MRSPPRLHSLLLSSLLAACAGSEPPPQEPPQPPPADTAPAAVAPPAVTAAPAIATAPPAPQTPPAEPPPTPAVEEHFKVPGANLSMASLEADGVHLKALSCKVDGAMGLLGAVMLGAGFSKQKTQLDACAPGKVAETPLVWSASGGKIVDVKADGPDGKVNRCVEKALRGAVAPLPTKCAGTLVHGKGAR